VSNLALMRSRHHHFLDAARTVSVYILYEGETIAANFDHEMSRKVEAVYSTPDVVTQRKQVIQTLRLAAGEYVLDIGSGPGF